MAVLKRHFGPDFPPGMAPYLGRSPTGWVAHPELFRQIRRDDSHEQTRAAVVIEVVPAFPSVTQFIVLFERGAFVVVQQSPREPAVRPYRLAGESRVATLVASIATKVDRRSTGIDSIDEKQDAISRSVSFYPERDVVGFS